MGTRGPDWARAVLGFQQRLVSSQVSSVRACNPPGLACRDSWVVGCPSGRWGWQPLGDQVTQRRGDEGETGGPGLGSSGASGRAGLDPVLRWMAVSGDLRAVQAAEQGESDCGPAGVRGQEEERVWPPAGSVGARGEYGLGRVGVRGQGRLLLGMTERPGKGPSRNCGAESCWDTQLIPE